ncbi:MAG: 4Fe-4S dicluster domain-containing protein [Pseudomonadota bacterium]
MTDLTQRIREAAHRLLRDNRVEAVIGFIPGSLPTLTRPFAARTPKEADLLVWNSHCRLNLANYLGKIPGRVAVTAKGCDSRSLAVAVSEGRISREELHVIGIPCRGMIDPRKVSALAGRDAAGVEETGNTIRILTPGCVLERPRFELLRDNCLRCTRKNPVLADETIGDPVIEEGPGSRYTVVEAMESLPPRERYDRIDAILAGCIRCYACRDACPLCFCPRCFVDGSEPQWLGKGTGQNDIRTFHILKSFHMAGRCTDCGACESACPMGIKLSRLLLKLEKDCGELFGWEAGMTPDVRPALDRFDPSDPEPFIL